MADIDKSSLSVFVTGNGIDKHGKLELVEALKLAEYVINGFPCEEEEKENIAFVQWLTIRTRKCLKLFWHEVEMAAKELM